MKLLKKSALNSELQLQKTKQIDEGVRIATKVDKLRETLTDLEVQHSTFAQRKMDEMNAALDEKRTEVLVLKDHIKDLEAKRAKLMEPLDKEKEELKSAAELILAKSVEADVKWNNLLQVEQETMDRRKVLEQEIKTLEKQKREAEVLFSDGEQFKAQTYRVLQEANDKNTAVDLEVKEKKTLITKRESAVAVRERELDILKAQLDSKQIDITKREIVLADREAMLERDIKRIKENGKRTN